MKERLATCTQSGLAGTHESGATAETVWRIMCLLYCITSLLRSTRAYYSSVDVAVATLAGVFRRRKRATQANSGAEADVGDTKEAENVGALCVWLLDEEQSEVGT